MKFTFLTLFWLLLFSSSATAGEIKDKIASLPVSEPVKCYENVWGSKSKDIPGMGLTAGQAVTLCSGTVDAARTILCFVQAWSHPDDGGLGLTAGQAVALCKSNSLR